MSFSEAITTLREKITNFTQGKKKQDVGMIQSNDAVIPFVNPIYSQAGRSTGNKMIDTDKIFSDALSRGASDIHIEPGESDVKIRMRVDGRFVEYETLGDHEKAPLIARIKILSGLKIDEQRLPQDGKANYNDISTQRNIDLRVSIIPTIYGEKVVIRVLRKESEHMDLRSIGVLPMNMMKLKKHLANQFGLILIV